MSAGTSEMSVKSGSALPVFVSVPPLQTTLGLAPSGGIKVATLKKPSELVVPEGSPSPCSLLPFRSMKHSAPAIGASTTRPSNASVTVMLID